MPAKSSKNGASKSVAAPIPLISTPSLPLPSTAASTTIPTAPAATSLPVVLSTTPPIVDLPIPPQNYNPVLLAAYRGYHPRTGQIAAIPDVVTELTSSDAYSDNLGPAAPEAAPFAQLLGDAVGWTNMRTSVEAFLVYVKSQEAITWKTAIIEIDQAKAIYEVVVARNPDLPKALPALSRLLEVANVIAQKSAVTRARNAKTKVADALKGATAATPVATPATEATSAPVVTSSTVTGGSGGVAH